MKKLLLFLISFVLLEVFNVQAGLPINFKKIQDNPSKIISRAKCLASVSQIEQSINNVRARLLAGGDVWWDGKTNPKYIVPKVSLGQPEVSSIFAGAVWIGGKGDGNNLKLAAMTYRSNGTDFWPGPLDKNTGETESQQCADWDRHFKVLGSNIRQHINEYKKAKAEGLSYNCSNIPSDVKGWPGKNNPYFEEIHSFSLPTTDQGLAPFFDENGDDNYDPCDGDYPIIEIRNCDDNIFADEMIYWIYNDNGNVHTLAKGSEAIKMEVQVQAFAYATNDELNNMTFQRYKLINRATELIKECYFAMWLDPDLGCAADDYIGCDSSRSLMYVYNQDEFDGIQGCNCTTTNGSTNTYCDKIPILGCDYFRGPLIIRVDDKYNPIDTTIGKMTSFTLYVNGGGIYGNAGADPQTASEYYNYITGRWRDGTRLTYGGNGYNPQSTNYTNFAFTDEPCKPNGWSMANVAFPGQDFRTLQATGPITLLPGQVNELIIGLPWVSDVKHPKPCISQIQQADDIAQALFDACFKLPDGPDAPDLDFIELNNELVMIMSNDPITSNNFNESYNLRVNIAPNDAIDTSYQFEGYVVYQLSRKDVTDFTDPDLARVVAQVDIKNKIKKIYNWESYKDPLSGNLLYRPISMTENATDEGIKHVFHFTEDQFASKNEKKLINHKKYYYRAIAYAHNSFEKFDPIKGTGQFKPYLEGRNNIKIYEAIPRPIVDRTLQSGYGESVEIVRLDGVGTSGKFLDISDDYRDLIFNNKNNDSIKYLQNNGPFDIKIFNPLDVSDGNYQLVIEDSNLNDDTLDNKTASWTLTKLGTTDVIKSQSTLAKINEQAIAKFGFSINLHQVNEVGSDPINDKTNGAIGGTISYSNSSKPQWLTTNVNGTINDGNISYSGPIFKSISNKEETTDPDYKLDPYQGLSSIGPMQPYMLCDYRARPVQGTINPYLTPGWLLDNTFGGVTRSSLDSLNNIDIVITSDKSKWSRCVVLETANIFYYGSKSQNANYLEYKTEENPDKKNPQYLELRGKLSVGKYDKNSDGLPDADGEVDENGKALYGMGWFPGYAIDVETGQRLNIFFGENSTYRDQYQVTEQVNVNGNDMLWNPSSNVLNIVPNVNPFSHAYSQVLGGQHYIYVSKSKYDECSAIRKSFLLSKAVRASQFRRVTWTCMPVLKSGTSLLPLGGGESGLIPNDLIIKMRVNNSYKREIGVGTNNGYPTYLFSIKNKQALALNSATTNSALDMINVVPNPYYGYSAYETNVFANIVKITNLPAKCVVTIYSLDGQFIKQYKRDEKPFTIGRTSAGINHTQITPALEWDLKNNKGIPVSSGVYLIHVNAEGMGERVIKWFGVARQYDPSGL